MKKDFLQKILEIMFKIRKFELAVEMNFQLGHVYGTAHLAIGQEAVATGSILALKKDDIITSNHRGHGHSIAKGASVKLMMAEIFGRSNGYCKGKGGSMHLADVDNGNLGSNGIVGGSTGIATGAALAVKKLKTNQIVICFTGEGAINEGIWHESVNIASIWDLPIIYFVENNQYSMGMPVRKAVNLNILSNRAKGYNIKGYTLDGNDVLETYKKVKNIAQKVRRDSKPVVLEAVTYRFRGHSLRDSQKYRPKGEAKRWLENYCPIKRFKKYLIDSKEFNIGDINNIEKKVDQEVEEAVKFALKSPFPEISSLQENIYV